MIDLSTLDLRRLQQESARALMTMEATNNNIYKFNQQAHHNSQNWYKAVIQWYVDQYGDLPSRAGPGLEIKLVMEQQCTDTTK
jgi:hypothetical protein